MRQRTLKSTSVLKILTFLSIFNLKKEISVSLGRCHSPMVKCLVVTKERWSHESLNELEIRNVCDATLCRRQNISNVHLPLSSCNQVTDIESHNQIRLTCDRFKRGETFCIFKHSILTSWLQRFNEPSDFSASQLQTISQTIGLRRDNRTIESHWTMKFYISMQRESKGHFWRMQYCCIWSKREKW